MLSIVFEALFSCKFQILGYNLHFFGVLLVLWAHGEMELRFFQLIPGAHGTVGIDFRRSGDGSPARRDKL